MDSLRGKFGAFDAGDEDASWDETDDELELSVDDMPPCPVGQDERRMQVRAYNYWASMLGERSFPSVEDIEPDNLPDFAANSVLLDFTGGMENPAIAFLGDKLAGECGSDSRIETLDDVPARSLLSRITDHYMQILANEAPIGFEAEFINQRDATILYRGILLPFSTDDETIDFIYGVINWKEVADQLTTDELLLEIDNALDGTPGDRQDEEPLPQPEPRSVVSPRIASWADGPGASDDDPDEEEEAFPSPNFARLDEYLGGASVPAPVNDESEPVAYGNGHFDADAQPQVATSFDSEADDCARERPAGLHALLADARELAFAFSSAEERSRAALYRAVSRAHDVGLAARQEPEDFAALLEENGIVESERAPLTPVIKLVFGADYDKSRLAEYAAVLAFAQRHEIESGMLADYLEAFEGGLKGVVADERAYRRARSGKPAQRSSARTYRKLGKIDAKPLSAIPAEGSEYSVCVIHRTEDGEVVFLGEVADDDRLLARAAKHLIG